MRFPGVWMTQSQSMIYRVVPKCACSTIGQILYYSDHGRFYDGDIHDDTEGLHKWGIEASRKPIRAAVQAGTTLRFTAVRNPYARILSSFFDKICGIQRTGNRYRGTMVPLIVQRYGIAVGGADGTEPFDQIASFRRFLLFARDTIRWRRPMEPDIHWSAMAGHVGTFVTNGGRYDRIIATEDFTNGMQGILDAAPVAHPVDLARIPRFNESAGHGPRRAHPIPAYFDDDLTMHLMREIYGKDFDLFGYAYDDPGKQAPVAPVDLDRVHATLGR